ncbi:MAG TPA: hypothetical protein VJK05_01020 [archaeon]|nr:hypothetical protein [archaeon]
MEEKEIKCVFCEGKALLKFEDLKLLEGKSILKDSPYFKCINCRKEFVSSNQMKETEKQLIT